MATNSRDRIDLEQLRTRLPEKPRTKAGQVRQAWPYIKELFDAGHSLKDICTWLNEIGIAIGYARLSHYVGRLRRAETAMLNSQLSAVSEPPSSNSIPALPPELHAPPKVSPENPLANVIERQEKRPGFHYNSEPDLKKLI